MKNLQIEKIGDWQIATALGKTGWVAWAKMGRIMGSDPVREPGNHVWFEFGVTRENASIKLKNELGLSTE